MHAGVPHSEWLGERPGSALPANRTAYRAGIGPSVMVRGITASSQFGIYTDGVETLQIASTRISINGNLTSVRHPVTITAEKTFAFGGGAIVARRRDALERLTAVFRVSTTSRSTSGSAATAWRGRTMTLPRICGRRRRC